ncbi:MAG TPA: hypothetical protein VD902_21615 [Symbiobacteriaceae bacterium]|nr:hypothetical protein [Symbiobacteriaceae bacterium]
MSESITPQSLTPSEILLLHAEAWAGPGASAEENIALLRPGKAASAPQLAEMLLAAAFLANEEARGLELEMFPYENSVSGERGMGLTINPGEDVPDWPAHSLEFHVWRLMAQGDSCVADVVYDLIQETPQPAHAVVRFTAKSFEPPRAETVADLDRFAGLIPLDPVSGLLQRTSQERPALWAELFSEIRLGLDQCKS